MHQAYFDRKLSQPTTISNPRSITPKPFSRIFEDSNRSPERLNSEISQGNTSSPAVNRSKYRNNSSNLGSSLKLSSKSREQVLYTDRSGNRVNQAYNYNAKNTYNHGMEPMRIKSERTQSVITKTEPNLDSDNAGQTAILLQKISKMKSEMTYLQEKESMYLSKLTNLERESKSLQRILEEKDSKIQEMTQKVNDDKTQIYQLLTELEAYKQSNLKQYRFDSTGTASSTMRLSELCDSTRKGDKAISLDKCIQAIEANATNPECSRCGNVTSLCEHLMNRLNEVDQDSRTIIKEHNSMKELLLRARKAENDSLKARGEIEKRVMNLQNELDIQTKFLNEIVAENSSIRKVLTEAINPNAVPSQDASEMRKSWRVSFKISSRKQIYPIPASMKALVAAEKVLKVIS